MICKRCGSELKPQAKFCPKCGEKVVKPEYCPNCGKVLESGVKFCSSCGTPIVKGVKGKSVSGSEDAIAEEITKQVTPESMEAESANSPVLEQVAHIRTLEIFKAELKRLGDEDNESKAVVLSLGTSVFYKHFYPLLQEDERLLAIRNIQSKTLFARYRKEFVALTDKRVIKFEKMQYFSPRIESVFYEEIREVKSDESSNAISETFIGEKVCISSWDDRKINMRMVGKGAAKELEDRIMQEKNRYGNSLPSGKISIEGGKKGIKAKKSHGKKRKILVVSAIAIILLAAGSLVVRSMNELQPKELSEYLQYDQEQLTPFLSQEKMVTSEMDPDSCTNGKIVIILNDKKGISFLHAVSPEYTLYGIQVGMEFSTMKDSKILHAQGYSLSGGSQEGDSYTALFKSSDGSKTIGITTKEGIVTDIMYSLENNNSGNTEISGNSKGFIFADSDKRVLENSEIEQLSDYEKLYAMYEILARHGAIFLNVEDGDSIQAYFNSQDWYIPTIPVEEIYEKDLNSIEGENIKKISGLITVDATNDSLVDNNSNMILPESGSRYLTQEDLAGLDKETLRLARNEIYARHGRKFETEDLNEYFSRQPWYLGYLSAEEFDDAVLNEYEKANIDLIKEVETGSAEGDFVSQLKPEDVSDSVYGSNNTGVTMEVGTYSDGGQIYVVFSNSNTELWRGELNRYQNLEYGGIALMFNGRNAVTGEEDYLTVEWITLDSIDFPTVDYEFDTIGISDSYSYAYKLTGN